MAETTKCLIPKDNCNVRSPEGYCNLNIVCEPIVEKCIGCSKAVNGYCVSYARPSLKWTADRICPVANHVEKKPAAQTEAKKRVGQQKSKGFKK